MRWTKAWRPAGRMIRCAARYLMVVERESFPLVDLRVDWHDEPIGELRTLWNRYAPQINDYLLRAVNPDDPSII